VGTVLDEVREQPDGVRFLRRVVERKLKTPLLLVGEEGVGRRFSVIHATKEMFCVEAKATGCKCFQCIQIDRGVHPDFEVILPDNGEVKVASIREMISSTQSMPEIAPVKVFIIDGADKMNPASANAILKTLEEPPPKCLFFLLAESAERVIPTIQSRCGLVQYKALSEPFILSMLQRSDDGVEKALVYARMSEGSVGRAVQYMGAGRLSFRDKVFGLLRSALEKNVPGLFGSIDSIEKELPLALRFLEQLVHDLIMIQASPASIIHQDIREDLGRASRAREDKVWHALLGEVRDLRGRIRSRVNLPFQFKNLFVQAFWI
jgi:DNA polymerase-3 subunit delta'